ncbi:MAG TPA: hypothetical protein VFW11_15490 [Cyclobacteriaceae bacterium]|nr:hypothetical protein [Cyclobacteriaceae bacterium]
MIKQFLLAGLLVVIYTAGMAQANYQVFEVIYVKPKLDKMDLFRKAMTAHNKKYHATAPYKASVSSIITGPNSGEYVWVMGPFTWAQMDGAPASGPGEHMGDWEKNINPNCESIGELMYWRTVPEVYYEAPGSANFKKNRMRASCVYPGQMERFTEQIKKVAEVFKQKKYPASISMATREGLASAPRPNVVTFVTFDKWAYWDNNTFEKDFDEVHGTGAYARFLEQIDLSLDRSTTYDELSEEMPELGG